jgi:GntR family transcriptional repressor for pyruvate dehydrogenase complex
MKHDSTDGTTDRPARRGNLVGIVEEALRTAIENGQIAVGDKLPSEFELTQRFSVSRTVIREAVSSLRLSGLVEARQGVGVFVLAPATAVTADGAFRIANPGRFSAVIELLEVRAAVEIEAAGLAALRRSPAQAEALRERLEDVEAAVAAGVGSTAPDLAFHFAVADATNNPQFRRLLELMGRDAIPRRALGGAADVAPADYMRQIQAEHRRIADAIAESDSETARAAMREHLEGSRDRYRALLRRG